MKYKTLNVLKKLLFFALIVTVIAIIYFIFNYKIYIVNSGSMYPTLQMNELIIVKQQDNESNYQKGDIVTYYDAEYDIFITHRVTEVLENGYFTKGDYNNTNDLGIIKDEQIVGKLVYHSLFLGNLFVKYKLALLVLLIIFIILCYISLFLNNTRKKESYI